MFVVGVPRWCRAPLGAACFSRAIALGHVPLLTELGNNSVGRGFYKHAAPSGAFVPSSGGELSRLKPTTNQVRPRALAGAMNPL